MSLKLSAIYLFCSINRLYCLCYVSSGCLKLDNLEQRFSLQTHIFCIVKILFLVKNRQF